MKHFENADIHAYGILCETLAQTHKKKDKENETNR